MTKAAREAIAAQLRKFGYCSFGLAPLVCRIVDRAVKAERKRWQFLDDIRLSALKDAEERLVARMKGTP